jgi:ligand-binding sensor domain-containing protein
MVTTKDEKIVVQTSGLHHNFFIETVMIDDHNAGFFSHKTLERRRLRTAADRPQEYHCINSLFIIVLTHREMDSCKIASKGNPSYVVLDSRDDSEDVMVSFHGKYHFHLVPNRSVPFPCGAAGLLICFFFFRLVSTSQAQSDSSIPTVLPVERITMENGISGNQIRKIHQDRLGFLWFVTNRGLTKFNGSDCIIYQNQWRNPDSLSNNQIMSLVEDENGIFWIGTEEGLNRFDSRKGIFRHYFHDPQNPAGISDNFVQSILKDRQGNLWIGMRNGGFNRMDPAQESFQQFRHDPNNPDSFPTGEIKCLAEDPTGNIWIGVLGNERLTRFDPKTHKVSHFGLQLPGENLPDVTSLLIESSGVIWYGTWDQGLYRYDPADGSYRNFRIQPSDPHSITSNIIHCLFMDEKKRLWIGTRGGGLCIFDPETERFHPVKMVWKTEPNHVVTTVLDIYQDTAGNMWFGSLDEGVYYYNSNQGQFQYFKNNPRDPASLYENLVYALSRDRDGAIWIGTDGGGLNRYDPKTGLFTHYKNNPSHLDSNSVVSLYEDRRGNLWVGSWLSRKGALSRFVRETQEFCLYPHEPTRSDGFHGEIVRAIREDHTGMIWIGTEGEGLNVLNPNTETFHHYKPQTPTQNGLSDKFIWCIHEDYSQTLWIGTNSGGLNRYDRAQDRFVVYLADPHNPNSLMNNTVYTIHEDCENALWLGTGRGLTRLSPDRTEFTHFTVEDGLADMVVKGILEDASGYLWISTENGNISRFDPQTCQFLNFDHSSGLQGREFTPNCCVKGLENELYFGGLDGLNCIWPGELTQNTYIPPIVFTAFHVMDKPYPIEPWVSTGKTKTLSYRENFLSFEFVALNYTQSHKNQYAYRLVPLEDNWNYSRHRRYARYTSLPPGEYTFQVKGSNNDGLWNEQGAAFHFVITPPFWATLQFRIFAIGLLVMFLAMGHYRRVRMMQMQHDQLKSEVEHALAEIKTLRGIVPICSYCKKIRDDQGYWEQLESYISEHSNAEFSHGICPECLKEHFPDFKDPIE